MQAIKHTLEEYQITYEEVKTWTTDGFYRETKDMVEYRKAEGCGVVEMECAALFACAKFRGAHFAQLLYTADSLADTRRYDARDWGKASVPIALRLCLDAVVKLKNVLDNDETIQYIMNSTGSTKEEIKEIFRQIGNFS